MNIFFLDRDPVAAARAQFDVHVPKMVVETAQILSSVHHRWGGDLSSSLYRATHTAHPSVVWAGNSSVNYLWTYEHFVALCNEYTHRFKKKHKTDTKLRNLLAHPPADIPQIPWCDPPQCMPDAHRKPDTVAAYRDYYQNGKEEWMHVWKKDATRRPDWFN